MARTIGPYELIKRLAVGGEAEVFLAKKAGLGGFEQQYALKLLLPHHAEDENRRKSMIDEARLTSQLDHPNIVKVHDLNEDGGAVYIVMEYVDGLSLAQLLGALGAVGERMPIEIAAFIATETCAGLHYAHTRQSADGADLQLVHRDVSPQNLLISYAGEIKLIDFGVAKAALTGRVETKTGLIKGKLAYMAPEYATGSQQDHRTDVFAVGLCLFEMLTGQAAYGLDDAMAVVDAVKNARMPRPAKLRNDIPPNLEQILAKALQLRPADRWESADQMRGSLAAFLSDYAPEFTKQRLSAWTVHLREKGEPPPQRKGATEPGRPIFADENAAAVAETQGMPVELAPPDALLGLSDLRSLAHGDGDEDELSVLETLAMEAEQAGPGETQPQAIQVRGGAEGLALNITDIPKGTLELVELGEYAEMPTATNIDVNQIRRDMVQTIAQPNRPQILTQSGFQRHASTDERPTIPGLDPERIPTIDEFAGELTSAVRDEFTVEAIAGVDELPEIEISLEDAQPLQRGAAPVQRTPRPNRPQILTQSGFQKHAVRPPGDAAPAEIEDDPLAVTGPNDIMPREIAPMPSMVRADAHPSQGSMSPATGERPMSIVAPPDIAPAPGAPAPQDLAMQRPPAKFMPVAPAPPIQGQPSSSQTTAFMEKLSSSYDSFSKTESGRRTTDILIVGVLVFVFVVVVAYVLLFN